MADAEPVNVLIAGGGVAALEAAFALRHVADERVVVDVVAPEEDFVYRPLAVVEPFRVGDVARFPLHTIVEAAGGRLRRGRITIDPDGTLETDAVVALPVLEGPRLAGIPHDDHGFVPTDELGRVDGLDGVYAAGDLVRFPVKQGGLATQQADTAASAIAASAGAPVRPAPFRPVLRGCS